MFRLALALFVAGMLGACTHAPVDRPTPEMAAAALLRLHRADREAHFRTDVKALLRNNSSEFISVANGKITRSTRKDGRELFTRYFKHAKYLEWDDLEKPVVRVSADGRMAWMITRVRVKRTQTDAAGNEKEEKFVYAGIMAYEKQGKTWMRVADVSTFEPAS